MRRRALLAASLLGMLLAPAPALARPSLLHPNVELSCTKLTTPLVVVKIGGAICLKAVGTLKGDVSVGSPSDSVTINGIPYQGTISVSWPATRKATDPITVSVRASKELQIGPVKASFAGSFDANRKPPAEVVVGSSTAKIQGLAPSGVAAPLLMWVDDKGLRHAAIRAAVDLSPLKPSVALTVAGDEKHGLPNSFQIIGRELRLKNIDIPELCLSYSATPGANTTCQPSQSAKRLEVVPPCPVGDSAWEGAGVLRLPTPSNILLGFWAGIDNSGVRYLGGQESDLEDERPLGEDLFLDAWALELCTSPLRLAGSATVRFNTSPAGLAHIDGTFVYEDARKTFTANGTLTLFRDTGYPLELADGFVQYTVPSTVLLGGRIHRDWGLVNASATVDGWYDEGAFGLSGHGEVCASVPLPFDADDPCETGDVVISSKGMGACVDLEAPSEIDPAHLIPSVSVGAGGDWGESPDIMASSCSLSDWRLNRGRATARQAGTQTFVVDPDELAVGVRVVGDGDAPQVALVGPGGRRIETPGPGRGAIQLGSHMIVPDPEHAATLVTIVDPAQGTWQVTPLEGSVPVTRVDLAEHAAKPVLRGHIVGKGRVRTLVYRYRSDASRYAIELVEHGTHAHHVLGSVKGRPCPDADPVPGLGRVRCGRLRFLAADGPSESRRIFAEVRRLDHRRLTWRLPVARFRSPAARRPEPPREVHIARHGTNVVVTWMSVAHARHFDVLLSSSHGDSRIQVVGGKQRTATFHRISPYATVRVTVAPFTHFARGRAAVHRSSGRPAGCRRLDGPHGELTEAQIHRDLERCKRQRNG